MDQLLSNGEVAMVGMVYAEILQGARTQREYAILRSRLVQLEFLESDHTAWEMAAEIAFELKLRGATIPLSDVTVAATVMRHDQPLYAVDDHFSRVPGLQLFRPII